MSSVHYRQEQPHEHGERGEVERSSLVPFCPASASSTSSVSSVAVTTSIATGKSSSSLPLASDSDDDDESMRKFSQTFATDLQLKRKRSAGDDDNIRFNEPNNDDINNESDDKDDRDKESDDEDDGDTVATNNPLAYHYALFFTGRHGRNYFKIGVPEWYNY